jgi:hypothetical protein
MVGEFERLLAVKREIEERLNAIKGIAELPKFPADVIGAARMAASKACAGRCSDSYVRGIEAGLYDDEVQVLIAATAIMNERNRYKLRPQIIPDDVRQIASNVCDEIFDAVTCTGDQIYMDRLKAEPAVANAILAERNFASDISAAAQRMADDYQTSESHHPHHVLVPRDAFEAMLSSIGLSISHEAADIDAIDVLQAENQRLREALETIATSFHGNNPSMAYADAPREDYLAHVLFEARKFASSALERSDDATG